jgi:septin family protein
LDPIPEFIQRIIKLFDNAKIRNGIMLIGESGAGKTVAFNALCESLKL